MVCGLIRSERGGQLVELQGPQSGIRLWRPHASRSAFLERKWPRTLVRAADHATWGSEVERVPL